MSMEECIFCKIGSGEIAPKTVFENAGSIAFLDVHPVSAGHTVVIPRKHFPDIIAATEEDLSDVWKAVREATKILSLALNPKGFTIGINHGAAAGQAVPHLHVHIIPRYPGDGGKSLHSIVPQGPEEALESTYEKISKHQ